MKNIKNWSQISLKKYIELYNDSKNIENEIDLIYSRLNILFDMSYDDIDNLELSKLNEIKSMLAFMDKEPNQSKFKQEITINGTKLIFQSNFGKMQFGRFILIEELKKDKDNFINNIPKILNELYLTENGDSIGVDKIEQIDCETALSGFFFLYLLAMNYLPSDLTDYSMLDKIVMNLKKSKKEIKKLIVNQKTN